MSVSFGTKPADTDPRERDRGDELQLETGGAEGEHQGPVIVARRLEPDRDGQSEAPQDLDKALVIVGGVQHRHPPPTRLGRDSDQHLMTVLRNVDAYQNAGIRRSIGLGHGRVSLWCGSQNHHRDLSPGYGRPLRNLGAARAAIAFFGASFPTCYGTEFVARAVRDWIAAVGARTAYIEPGSPWENGYCESFNAKLRDELLNGEIFYSLAEAKTVIESWRRHYNPKRPHSSLGSGGHLVVGFAIRSRFAGHASRSAQTCHAPRLKPDHPMGAGRGS
jgi:hypothetical protein